MRKVVVPFIAVAVVGLGIACSSSDSRECHAGADCVSGVCTADGQCLPGGQGGDSGTGPVTTDSSSPNDSGILDAAIDGKTAGCVPNHDGQITRDEVPLQAGLHATYKVGHKETVSTAGETQQDGSRKWDFSAALASDVSVIVETLPMTGKWYAPDFTNAKYVTALRNDSNLLGIFNTPSATIELLGVASPDAPENDSSYTKLTNDPPVPVLTFPLKKGSTWTTTTQVSGTAQGVALFGSYTEKYESTADAEGELTTPLGTFHVIRVNTLLTRTVGFLPSEKYRTASFVTECYGTVANVASAKDEANVEFTNADEIRRIAP